MRNSLILAAFLPAIAAGQEAITSVEALYPDVSAARDEIVINALGDLWRIPASGGPGTRLVAPDLPASRARWSPDGSRLAFEAGLGVDTAIRLLDVDSGAVSSIGSGGNRDRHPDWHPSGERLVYASRRGGNFNLWETDLATGLAWQLTDSPGDDLEPAWSADGRHLTWIRRAGDRFWLMLREFGQPERILVAADAPLAAPSFRPDGTLITYFRGDGDGRELRMVILSDPVIDRPLVGGENLFPAPLSWLDRFTFYYVEAGTLRLRGLDAGTERPIPFRVSPTVAPAKPAFEVADRELPLMTPSSDRLVIRASRIWDGYSRNYREGVDVLVEGGLIADVTGSREWDDAIVIDLGTTTMLPGFIDVHARLPEGDPRITGPRLLAWGITTMVAVPGGFDAALWEDEAFPGPRLLDAAPLDAVGEPGGGDPPFLVVANRRAAAAAERVAAWQAAGIPVLADDRTTASDLDTFLLPAAEPATLLASLRAAGDRPGSGGQTFSLAERRLVSGLADRRTPGIDALFDTRQADGLRAALPLRARVLVLDDLRRSRSPLAIASAGNRLPPGLALHAEFLALADAGLGNDQVLRAAGRYAASLIGLGGAIGEIAVGAHADLVLVNGDPLARIEDAARIVAVVRNGRFFSLVNLLERGAAGVE